MRDLDGLRGAWRDRLNAQPARNLFWQFVDGQPIRHRFRRLRELPATTPESDRMSRDLRERGFKFAGPTICDAFMQAVGMVNDHTTGCFRYRQIASQRSR